MGKDTFNPVEGNTLGRTEGADWGTISDPIAQIAQRIGQLRAEGQMSQYSPGTNGSEQLALEQEIDPLQKLLDSYMNKQKMASAPHQMPAQQNTTPVLIDPYREIRNAAIASGTKFLQNYDPTAASMPGYKPTPSNSPGLPPMKK